jgi:hypothetical protein
MVVALEKSNRRLQRSRRFFNNQSRADRTSHAFDRSDRPNTNSDSHVGHEVEVSDREIEAGAAAIGVIRADKYPAWTAGGADWRRTALSHIHRSGEHATWLFAEGRVHLGVET